MKTTMKLRNPAILHNDPLLRRVWEQLGHPSGCCVTGGYVRDQLLGRPSNDLDLTIESSAERAGEPARRLAGALGVRAHLFGSAPHRIWRIETPALKIELWPLGGMAADEDIHRRDFGCNALSWKLPDGPLVDLVGGMEDLDRSRLRAISRANLESDPVRLLRAPRFLAQIPEFALDDQTRSWIEELSPSLAGAPRERVGQELLTLLRGPMTSLGLAQCLDLGLFFPAAPESTSIDERWLRTNLDAADALSIRGIEGGTPAPQQSDDRCGGEVPPGPQHAERHCGAGVPPARGRSGIGGDAARLAFLFRSWGLPADRELAPYAWPKAVRELALRAARLLDQAPTTVDAPPADRRELAWRAGAAFPTLIAVADALEPERAGWRRWWRQWRRDPAAFEDPHPLLTGREIAEISGILPGPELGEAVRGLLRAQVRGEIRSRGGAKRWLARNSGASLSQLR